LVLIIDANDRVLTNTTLHDLVVDLGRSFG
jgi:hypothetical protein